MASIHQQTNSAGTTYRVRWREDGKLKSQSFLDKPGATRFADNVNRYGPDEALRIADIEDSQKTVQSVTDYLTDYIDSLTGVQPATQNRYRGYLSRDITPVFGDLPITAVTEDTIGRWVTHLAKPRIVDGKTVTPSAKTIQNKHGFISGALKAAVRKQLIPTNPCEHRRLPEGQEAAMVMLTPAEFQMMHDCMPEHWKSLALFLVSTGMRFSEATALTVDDIDETARTCRINKAWKYSTARADLKLGPPKSKKSNRTISLSRTAMSCIDLTQPEWLFTNRVGNPVRAQEFFNVAWKPAREKAQALGLKKSPRVHDLRHTHASWLINDGTPLPIVQARLGHENINTTIAKYFHVDQRAERQAADSIDQKLGPAVRALTSVAEQGIPMVGGM